jgi:hypothetical protein
MALADLLESWDEAAAGLGVEVRSADAHEERWLASLDPRRAAERGEYAGVPRDPHDIDAALDAAVGVARAVEQWQRTWLGRAGVRLDHSAGRVLNRLRLDRHPPAGVDLDTWRAVTAVMEGDYETWAVAAEAIPEAVAVLEDLQKRRPAYLERVRDAALNTGQRVDAAVRPTVLADLEGLGAGVVFRGVWKLVFGQDAGIQPAAPRQIGVYVLTEAGLDLRSVGLFLAHVGLTHTSLDGSATGLVDRLGALDTEVRNAQQKWRSLAQAGGVGPHYLVDLLEEATVERLARAAPPP